jgi:hypothetical protein
MADNYGHVTDEDLLNNDKGPLQRHIPITACHHHDDIPTYYLRASVTTGIMYLATSSIDRII